MPTNIFDSELTAEQLKAGVSGITVEDLNRQIVGRGAFIQSQVAQMLTGFAMDVPTVGKMKDVSAAPNAMKKVGEMGRTLSQADRQVVELDFPLWKWEYETGWTEDFMLQASVEDFRKTVLDAEYAYNSALTDELKTAVFNNVRREFADKFETKRNPVYGYSFYNADGMAIPPNAAGTTFTAATHQHYNGTSGAAVSVYDIDTLLISNVVEHGDMFGIALFVPSNMKATLEAITSTKFLSVLRPNTVYRNDANRDVFVDNLDSDPDNKLIGHWDGYPVFSRSWCPTSYIACLATGQPEKALGYRQPPYWKGLSPLPRLGNNIVTAEIWRAYFGIAANNRGAGAVLDTAHQTTYTAPTLVL